MLRARLRKIHFLHTLFRALIMMYKRKRYGLKHVHKTFFMNGKSNVSRDLIAHEYSGMGEECYIGPNVELGPYAMIGPRVAIVGGDHRYDIPGTPIIFSGRAQVDKTTIEADVWIGYGAIVMAGNTIGRGAIIGAGSVVTKKIIGPYEVYMGVPARRVFDRFPNPSDRKRHDEMLAGKPSEGEWPPPFVD
jgi:UDP-3-O-[3-hydroxymyristoyl] glucosamine N-acyltransferase